jgi:ankyrin repeat protein
VLGRDLAMVNLLMEAGADARKGIFPHRDATTAWAIARDRGYDDVVHAIERQEQSRANANLSPAPDRLAAAIANGNRAEATALLESDRALIHSRDRDGRTPLHIAARAADLELTAWLLTRGANAAKQDASGLAPIDCAALAADPRNEHARRFPEIATLLIRHGAPVTIRAAVALGESARVRELLHENPAPLREISSSGGLLTLAVNHARIEMVRLLLDLGVDVDERIRLAELEEPVESWGMPLWYAALAGHAEIARILLDRGADPNANVYASGWPLRNAWNHADDSVKRLLLERGARRHPYMVAEAHDVEEARRLLEADASEETARELAWSAACHGCAAIVELALPMLAWPRSDPLELVADPTGARDRRRPPRRPLRMHGGAAAAWRRPQCFAPWPECFAFHRRASRRNHRHGARPFRGHAARPRRAP